MNEFFFCDIANLQIFFRRTDELRKIILRNSQTEKGYVSLSFHIYMRHPITVWDVKGELIDSITRPTCQLRRLGSQITWCDWLNIRGHRQWFIFLHFVHWYFHLKNKVKAAFQISNHRQVMLPINLGNEDIDI